MKSNKRISLILIITIIVVIVVGTIVCVVAVKNEKNKGVTNQNSEIENSSENNDSTNQEIEENKNDNDDYESQRKKMQDKIDEINASTINGNIPSDLILRINGKDVSYDYNWTYNGFKEEYNQENIFEEGQSNYYLLYANDELKYKIDFKLFPTVSNSVSNVALGVSNIIFSKKSDNVNKEWGIAGIYLQDDLTAVLEMLGNSDSAEIIEVEGEFVDGIICSWKNVWFGDKCANISIEFDINFKVKRINIGTIIYDTQKIDKYKAESKHVSN